MATADKDFRVKNGIVVTEKTTTSASTTTRAGLVIPHGTAPTAPVNGDIWTTTAGLYARINGVTVGPFGAGGGASVTISDTAPVSPTAGSLWFKSSTAVTYIFYDSFWIQMGGGGGMPNPLTTTGDTVYSSSGTTPNRLAIGTAGQAYTVNAGATAPQWSTLTLENLPGAFVKKSARVATTANVTLTAGAPNVVDGITLAANDRILVKDQSAPAQNGIYIVQALGSGANGTWVRSLDADTIGEIASAMTAVDAGTVSGGFTFDNDLRTTDTLGTTAVTWSRIVDFGYSINIGTTAVPIGRASAALTLAGITLTTPTIGDLTNMNHTHAGATSGGNIPQSSVTSLTTDLSNKAATNQAFFLGTTSIAINRTSAAIALTGITSIDGSAASATTATNATNTAITDDIATAATMYPTWVTATTGNLPQRTSSTKLTFNPSTGVLTATQFSGSGAGLTAIPQSGVTNLTSDLALKSNIASPTFTGTVSSPKYVATGAQTLAEYRMRNFYVSTTDPGTGNDGDIWLKY